jgi:ribose 5-phosphate isomerase B
MSDVPEFKVLFVCTGNTCRSPMAEGITRKLASERKADHIKVCSAGTIAPDGLSATEYAIEAARHWDVDISAHFSTPLDKKMVGKANLILAMEHGHIKKIISIDSSASSRSYLLKAFPEPYNVGQEQVDDPIGGTLDQYNQTFLELDEVIHKIFPQIIGMSQPKG